MKKDGNGKTAKLSQEDIFRNLPVPSALRVMIVPAVISQLTVLIYNMADTFYVGQTGNPYMVAGRPSSFRYSISPSAWPAWPESAAAP